MEKKSIKLFNIKDWYKAIGWATVLTGLYALLAFLKPCIISEEAFSEFVQIIFIYATTTLALLISAYTILQGINSPKLEEIKKWSFYLRYKMNLIHTLYILVVLAIVSLLSMLISGSLTSRIYIIVNSLNLFLTIITLISIVVWVKLLITYVT